MVMRQYQAHLRCDMVLSPSSESSRYIAERSDSGGLAVPLRRVRGNGPTVLGGCVRGPSQRLRNTCPRSRRGLAEWCRGVAAESAPAMSPAPPVGDIALPPVLP